MRYPTIFEFVKGEELAFEQDWEITQNWQFNFKKHVNWTILFKHGKFPISPNDYTRANKNIILPILNVQYRAEDIDLKDVNIFVNDSSLFHLSFLVKKYHEEVYAPKHHLNTLFDELKEEKIDFGAVIVRRGRDGWVWEQLETLAFADRDDFLRGPICFKNEYTPEELYEKEKIGWGKTGADTTISELIELFEVSNTERKNKGQKQNDKIEVYRVHGSLPSGWLGAEIKDKYTRQLQIIAFYQNADGKSTGVTLYKNRELKNPFKVHLRTKKIKNRNIGYGAVEELFSPQIWVNFSEIVKHGFLKAASKVSLWTDDETFANKNNVKNQENLELNFLQQGRQVGQIPTAPVNMRLFDNWIAEMEIHAQKTGSATDPLMGEPSASGTPFRSQNQQVVQGTAIHDYRKENYEDFLQELYEDGILEDIVKEIVNGTEFLATLSPDEIEYVQDCLVKNTIAKQDVERVLSGELPLNDFEKAELEAKVKEGFSRNGSTRFIRILKDEFADVKLKVKVRIGSRGKDLFNMATKAIDIFQQVMNNPAILDDPRAAKTFSKIIEWLGMSPIDFGMTKNYQKPQQVAQGQMQQIPPMQMTANQV